MIDSTHKLPVARQATLLALSRASVYYRPQAVSEADLVLMRRIDEIHLEHPFAGARMLRDMLRRDGHEVGRKHVTALMKRIGIEALYRRPNTSKPNLAHRIYPYLLRELAIDRPNQAWAMDITYIPMARGFVYLAAVMDWASRRVLACRLSNTMTADAPIEALQEAIVKYGTPPSRRFASRSSRHAPDCQRPVSGASGAVNHPPWRHQRPVLGRSRVSCRAARTPNASSMPPPPKSPSRLSGTAGGSPRPPMAWSTPLVAML